TAKTNQTQVIAKKSQKIIRFFEEGKMLSEFLTTIYFKWLLIDFFSFFFLVYLVAFLAVKTTRATRLEKTALNGYLWGIFLHLLLTITFMALMFKQLYDLDEPWSRIWTYQAGFIVLFVTELLCAFVIGSKIKNLPILETA
ncbi:MAG: hypothetical protein ACE5I1_26460, partial [bacterium]